jgi:hypothetical protein
MMRTLEQ